MSGDWLYSHDPHPWIPTRLKLMWHVLRGRPVMYRMTIGGPIWVPKDSRALVVDCHVNPPRHDDVEGVT